METLWFWLVAIGVAAYVILDGYDIGAGAMHLLTGRDEAERAQILASIAPFWDGNEVWLIAGGGTLYFAFPTLYSAAFSGFYLPLMVVLWLLILRGIAIEFRHALQSPIWTPFWDVTFSLSSALLALFFGAALGNIVRGVPLDANAEFFLPLWTDFRVSANPGVLDWYTVLTGLLALATLMHHGALWIAYKTPDPVQHCAMAQSRLLWFAVILLTIAATLASFAVQPHLLQSLAERPWGYGFSLLALAGLFFSRLGRGQLGRFLGSCAYIAGMLTTLVHGVYPYVLPAVQNPGQPDLGLTVRNASAPLYGLQIGLVWWLPALVLAIAYSAFVHRRFAGKVPA